MATIFISYRRADSDEAIKRLRAALQTQFGEENIFFDTVSLRPGDVFTDQIRSQVKTCRAFLAVIGRQWTGISGATGACRLNDADDFIRLEVEAAFKYRRKVIPVILDGASLPSRSDLPPSLWPLLERQAHEIRAGHLEVDVGALISHLNHELRLIPWEAGRDE